MTSSPRFTTRAEALTEAQAALLPADCGARWGPLTAPRDTWRSDRRVLERFGALPQTMHFGCLELDLAAREVRFVDQDHRDGGDLVVHRAPLPPEWVERLARLEG